MKINITNVKKSNLVNLKSLRPGALFECAGVTYIKTARIYGSSVDCVRLHDGEPMVCGLTEVGTAFAKGDTVTLTQE